MFFIGLYYSVYKITTLSCNGYQIILWGNLMPLLDSDSSEITGNEGRERGGITCNSIMCYVLCILNGRLPGAPCKSDSKRKKITIAVELNQKLLTTTKF